jgi:hypothetical protein
MKNKKTQVQILDEASKTFAKALVIWVSSVARAFGNDVSMKEIFEDDELLDYVEAFPRKLTEMVISKTSKKDKE